MKGGIGPTILINLVLTLVLSGAFGISDQVGIRISTGGHLGGLAAGLVCGVVMFGLSPAQAQARRATRRQLGHRRRARSAAAAGVAAAYA